MDLARDLERMRDYVVGRLSDEERRVFEDRLVREPELVREFEQSLRLREGLQQLEAQGQLRSATGATSTRRWWPALAAAALAAVALVVWIQPWNSGVLRSSLGTPHAGAATPVVAAQFTFVSMRGAAAPELALPSSGTIDFRAAPANRIAGTLYRATLLQEDAAGGRSLVGRASGLPLGTDGYVHSYAEAALLKPGRYELRIEAPGADGAQSFEFVFRLPGPAGSP